MNEDVVWVPVLPSLRDFDRELGTRGAEAGKRAGEMTAKAMADAVAKGQASVEKAVAGVEKARNREADATGKVRIAQAEYNKIVQSGEQDAVKLARAEEKLEAAKRKEAEATGATTAAAKKLAAEEKSLEDKTKAAARAAEEQGRAVRVSSGDMDKAENSAGKLGDTVAGLGSKLKSYGMIAAGVAGLGGIGTILTKGLDRLTAIDNAKAKLSGLGHEAASVDEIMQNAMASVKGTAFGLGDAAGIAAGAVAAGIKPGKDLERTLKVVGDAASIAGTDLGSMGSIFNKVAASNKIQGDVIAQLSDAGIPVVQLLGKELGKTSEEVVKMASDGKINFETFQNAMEKGMGGAALKAGNTFKGAVDNAGAALGRLGAAILDAPFKAAPGIIGRITDGVDGLTDKTKGLSELLFTGTFGEAWEKAFPDKDLDNSTLARFIVGINDGMHTLGATMRLFRTGDYTADIGFALGVDEDSPLVDNILRVRELVQDWMTRLGGIFDTLKGGAESLIGPIGTIIGSLGAASAAIGFSTWDMFLTLLEVLTPIIVNTLVPAVETLAKFMDDNQWAVTALVGAFTAYKVASVTYTAVTAGMTTATKLWSIATNIAAIKQKLLNNAMKFSKIGLIITAITLVVGALTWFFTKTELGQKIVEKFKEIVGKAWGWISDKLSQAWGFIQPIFEKIWGFLSETLPKAFGAFREIVGNVWDKITDVISGAWQVIKGIWDGLMDAAKIVAAIVMTVLIAPLMIAWNLLSAAIQYAWNTFIKPVFELWATVAQWLWNSVLQPAWEGMQRGFEILGNFFQWVWQNIIKPAWDGLGAGIKWVWENVIQPVWNTLKAALNVVGTFFSWVWNSIIKPAWDGLGNGIRIVWENVIRPAWDGLKAALQAVGDFFVMIWERFIKPAWDALGDGISWVVDNIVKPAWDKMQEGLGKLRDFFDTIVEGIRKIWEKLKGFLAKPVNFMINTVWNEGIRKAWNKVSEFIPGLPEAGELKGIPEHATGGAIRGPGTGTSDDVLMWGSNGEHMLTTAEVQRVGGHNAVYALRDMIMRGVPFTWDGGQIIRELGRDNVNAYGAQVAAKGLGNVNPQGMFDWLLPAYKDGGEIRPAWHAQLENGHRAAKMRNGNPYTWGFEDCSGYMSAIADAIINGGDGKWTWATGSFPGGQPWVPGLGEGFSVGVWDDPGGPGGGHTAGTLTGVGQYSTVNVESGGAHNYVAYGGPAVGADAPIFAGKSPGLFHLAIGADGAFETAGGPSPEQKQSWLQRKINSVLDLALDPIKSGIGAAIGTPPPEWLGIPPRYLDTGRDKVSGFLSEKVLGLGNLLGSAWDKAKGLFRDQGGWLPKGLSLVRNETGKPEAVLNWDQVDDLNRIIDGGMSALGAIPQQGLSAAEAVAWEALVPHLIDVEAAMEMFDGLVADLDTAMAKVPGSAFEEQSREALDFFGLGKWGDLLFADQPQAVSVTPEPVADGLTDPGAADTVTESDRVDNPPPAAEPGQRSPLVVIEKAEAFDLQELVDELTRELRHAILSDGMNGGWDG
ncbi:tape measure protein [Prescottella equi]